MSSQAVCSTVGNLGNYGSLVGLGLQGLASVAIGYQSYGSPYTTLQEVWKTLQVIRTYLENIPSERRQKIEAAARRRLCRPLKEIEDQFRDLWDTHADLSQEYEKSSYWNRHVSGELRALVFNLEKEVKSLLNDTRTTTRAHALPVDPPPPPPPLATPGNQGRKSTNIPPGPAGSGARPSLHNTDTNHEAIEMGAV